MASRSANGIKETPLVLGTIIRDVPNQDLHFWKSPACTTVAHADSLVKY